MVSTIVNIFMWVNLYAFFLLSHMRMLRDYHGLRRGFVMSNIIIVAALLLVLVLAYQINNG
ncbi:MAG TPA: hypothetical protein VJH88_05315 [Candidatus Nanoarchaeia archaeon]|nr:hypothetical protein [Candidatus Nanoarchaeia archaeon]